MIIICVTCIVCQQFRRISDLETAEQGAVVDILGVVESCEPWVNITRKNGEEVKVMAIGMYAHFISLCVLHTSFCCTFSSDVCMFHFVGCTLRIS